MRARYMTRKRRAEKERAARARAHRWSLISLSIFVILIAFIGHKTKIAEIKQAQADTLSVQMEVTDNRVKALMEVTGAPYSWGSHDTEMNIRFAKWIYDNQGWGPWTCSAIVGVI